MRRPASEAAAGPYATWSSGTYSYDGAGNINRIGPSWYTYDLVSRLTLGTLYDGPTGGGTQKTQSYAFDPFGNLTNIAGTSGRSTPTDSTTNRLNGTRTQYDAAGNLTNWNGAVYIYDHFNQMAEMLSGNEHFYYVYTADDERVWSYDNTRNLSHWTLRDMGGKVLRDYINNQGTWSLGTDYFYRDGLLLAAETQTGQRHYHLDHLGTPRLITRGSGYLAAYHVYYSFGEEATAFNQDTERMKFTGHERDLASPTGPGDDLDYTHARHESPVTGRFLSVDRHAGDSRRPQTWNRYAYVSNNPLQKLDPSGLVELTFTLIAFIPDTKVSAPSFSGMRTFKGDGRTFGTRGGTFRTQQSVKIETDPGRAANSLLAQTNVAGRTFELNANGTVKDSGIAKTVGSSVGSRDAQGNAVIQMTTDAKNPLITGAPAINNSLTIIASSSGNSVNVSGTLDGFPAVMLTVTNQQGQATPVIQFSPATVGNGPLSVLPGIGDQSVNVQCSGVGSGSGNCSPPPK